MDDAPICPLHNEPARLMDDAVIYGRSFGRVWICPFKGCDHRVGAHPNGEPKGTMAGASVRAARQRAHAAFDGWWKHHGIDRSAAYAELANRLGVAVAHIAEMDEAQCERVVELFT
jgi:hypothetical protein